MILVYLGRWSYGRFQDDNNIFFKMKNDLTTGTWQDDIWCPVIIISFCTSDVAPNPKVLNDLKPSKEQLEKVYGGIMKEVNELRLQIDSKKTLSCIDCQGKNFNTNIAKVQAQKVFYGLLMILN